MQIRVDGDGLGWTEDRCPYRLSSTTAGGVFFVEDGSAANAGTCVCVDPDGLHAGRRSATDLGPDQSENILDNASDSELFVPGTSVVFNIAVTANCLDSGCERFVPDGKYVRK